MILSLLFLAGLIWAARRGWDAAWEGSGKARTAARAKAAKAGGPSAAERGKRRAARQATAGWWAREARHGFPVTRHGFRQGWNDHGHVLAERNRDAAVQDATRARQQATWRKEIEEHWRKLREPQGDGEKGRHVAGDDKHYRAVGGVTFGELARTGRLDPNCPDCAAALAARKAEGGGDPPLPDGKTPGAGPPVPASNGKGDSPMADTNGSPKATDATYEEALRITEQAKNAADAADLEALDAIGPLVDGLGVVLNNDATTLGLGGDLAAECDRAKESLARVQDLAQALHDRVLTYQPQHEAVVAHDADAPEATFHDS
jgi:hypothetical protein